MYILWGSTYLAIKFAIATVPPLSMAAVRFLVAGAILYGWGRWRGEPTPSRAEWRSAAVIGALLLLIGNGGLVWAEQRVPTSLAALLIATEPSWVVLLNLFRPGSRRPGAAVIVGLLAGLVGVYLLIGGGGKVGDGGVDLLGAAAVVGGALSWAAGSLYAIKAPRPRSAAMSSGTQMLAGGAWLALASAVTGEWHRIVPSAISSSSILAMLYLIVFGSLVGFTAYGYLIAHTTPARASTYAYVNPAVAVLLGWLILGERLTGWALLGAAVIVGSVVLIVQESARKPADKSD